MTATAESRFNFGDDNIVPSPDDHILIEYMEEGKYGVFVQHTQWKPGNPLPSSGFFLEVQGRLYCLAMAGTLDGTIAYCKRLQPILAASNGVWISEAVSQVMYTREEDPYGALTPEEREWWKSNDGPFPGSSSMGGDDDEDD